MATNTIPQADLDSFTAHLLSSSRILALCGAGLSAASGLPTFRGAGGLWRSHEATSLATPEAFEENPGMVWQFYSYRRHMALEAKPNPAHYALAELAKLRRNFITLTQNVDGLSQRAHHPSSQLHLLHGSLFDLRCTSFYCNYTEENNYVDPIVPALAIPTESIEPLPSGSDPTGAEAGASLHRAMQGNRRELDISNDQVEIPHINRDQLPKCPKCTHGLLRPGVVWFGEPLPKATLAAVDGFIEESNQIDLILVIGTSSSVYPAAGYVDEARNKGARVAVINMDRNDAPRGNGGLSKDDWFFQGDAGVLLPQLLEPIIGDISVTRATALGQFPASQLL